MNFYEMLNKLEELNGSNDKEDYLVYILRHVKNAEPFFRFTFNDQVFGVKEKTFINAFPEYQKDYEHISDWFEQTILGNDEEPTSTTVPDLINLGLLLSTSSGGEQVALIRRWFLNLSQVKRKWFCRAILKDLRCGVQVKTVNKAFRRIGVPTIKKFAMQLCDKIDVYDEELVKKKLTFPCTMECKYDGIRIQAEVWESSATLSTHATMTSRRGKDRTDLYPEIIAELKDKFAGQHVILDCEVISRSFQSLMNKSDTNPKKLIIWDLLMDEKLPYKDRWSNLISLCQGLGISAYQPQNNQKDSITEYKDNQINNINSNLLFTAEHYSANNIQDIQEYYEHLNERGEEGIIIKLDSSPYERGTRKHMFKCKKVFTADLKCIGYKLGEGKRSGKVATLELIDASGQIRVDVGSGINDAMCEYLTSETDFDDITNTDYIGDIVEIKYNEITETQSIRNPRFVCFRDDKEEPDDLSNAEVRQA